MTRRLRRVLVGAGASALALGLIVAGPRTLRALPGFEVRAVEVSGTQLLDPRDVARAAGIRPGESLWNDAARWEEALESHPVIASASVRRRLPGTLRVQVEEKSAVAYVGEGALEPVTASGERLPVDPVLAPADLPIVRGLAGADPGPHLLAEVGRLALADPGLLAEVSEVEAADSTGTVLRLRHAAAEIVIPAGASAIRLSELRAVLGDVARRRSDAGEDVARVDLRFPDQIVVRLPSSVHTP